MTNIARKTFTALALPAVLTITWFLLSRNSTDFFMPPLTAILESFPETWFNADRIQNDVIPSLTRLLTGYLIAVALGVLGGLAIGSSRPLRQFLEPVFEFFRAIPAPVLIPIVMLFAGIEDTMKIIVIVMGCVWPVLLNTIEGVRGADEVQRDVARCFRLTRMQRFTLTLRAASPQTLAGARVALSLAVILMVISEMFAASSGVGFTIVQFQRNFAIPEMWSGILLLGFIGVTLAAIFAVFERQALRWYSGLRRTQKEGR
ncbi:ABC transporter permease [Rhodococcus qingshengii]|uniref:ABC transporter permease n=1 Tax=Rhodococcus qingshengii TaxID=334542 RepID=UPI0022B35DC6|nr:ABC transporter permease [Rhodococcus qingshengii]MCZ4618611.1 ABC transporter permease [Rhodococcus qingshengii]